MSDVRMFWQTLRQHQLVAGELPSELDQIPLYLRVFLSVTLWLAAQFAVLAVLALPAVLFAFIGFEGMAWPVALLGGALLGAASGISRRKTKFFIQQLGLAAALSGAGMLASGLFMLDIIKPVELLLMTVAVLVFALVRNTLVRTLCVPVLVIAGSYWLAGRAVEYGRTGLLPAVLPLLLLVTAWLYLMESRLSHWHAWQHPLKRGLTIALWLWLVLQASELFALGRGGLWAHVPLPLTLVAAGFVGWLLWQHRVERRLQAFALVLGLLLLAAGWLIPGMTVTVLLLALAWQQGQRYYWVSQLAALLLVLCQYYYSLEQSLLIKSYILLGLALVLFGMRLWLLRLEAVFREES